MGRGTVQFLGDDFSTSGFPLVAPERRGPIDVAAWSHHSWLSARWRQPVGDSVEATITARTFEEFRGNGTPYQRNGTRENFISAALAGQAGAKFSWNAVAYAEEESFASTFSSVNATRTAETPASNQFAVPATAAGAAWTGVWSQEGGATTSAGTDVRYVRGATNEDFTFTNGAYTRRRVAGGNQAFAGLSALREQPLLPDLHLTVGARLDEWSDGDGHRRETDLSSGAVLRDDHYADRDGTEFSPSAGLVWQPASAWRLRAAAQQAFRVPTLNELYRPFRQGTTVVETNPDLKTEHVTSGELGADWTQNQFTLGLTGFWNDLRNEVSNVTLARGPGTFPLFGTLAAGGIGQQRLNLDRTRVRGIALSAQWRPSKKLSFTADWLGNDATVRSAAVAPTLVGKRLAQVPRNNASVGATWRAPGRLTLTPRVRWIGRQFEDDENTLILGETVVVDFTASRPLSQHLELFLSIENLNNTRIETGRSADGVVNIGIPSPRLRRLARNVVRSSKFQPPSSSEASIFNPENFRSLVRQLEIEYSLDVGAWNLEVSHLAKTPDSPINSEYPASAESLILMLIRSPKDWEIPESAVTPEQLYRLRNRRDFLRTLGVGLAGAALASRPLLAATAGFPTKLNPAYPGGELKPTAYQYITGYNNFYEFGTDKADPAENANKGWKTDPWTIEVAGLVNQPAKFDINDLVSKIGIEQRVYRHRCVEAWSMVVPWDGFPLAKLVALADPKPEAKYLKFSSFVDPKSAVGQRERNLDYPYIEGLRLDEATNELAFIATGIYGRAIPNQNGAPLRLVTPWKYGFKGVKSIVKIEFTVKEPRNTWQMMASDEYGFYANVNPLVDHPRWSQASERVIGGGFSARQKTLMFNGYGKQVAALYKGLNLDRYF